MLIIIIIHEKKTYNSEKCQIRKESSQVWDGYQGTRSIYRYAGDDELRVRTARRNTSCCRPR
jgi:hypothetical protein